MEVEKLQRYDLVERIAAGGMGEVYRARATGPHGFEKTLAVKRILPELSSDREFVERFVRESKLSVSLSHANIVQVFDLGRSGDDLFLVMEYVHGTDLSRLLLSARTAGREVPIGIALLIAAEAAQGLAYAHGREDLDERSSSVSHGMGVIHCDISPSNLLLSYAGEVKLTDFGVAQLVDHTRRTATQAQNVMGKWRYMAPEQIRGEAVDARTDLYALGVVLYELLAGRKAFSGDGVKATCDQVLAGQAARVRTYRPGVSEELDEFIAAVMSVDARNRPADAREFLNQLAVHQQKLDERVTALDLGALVRELVPPPDGRQRRGLSGLFHLAAAPERSQPSQPQSHSGLRRRKPAASFVARVDPTGSESVTQWVQAEVSDSGFDAAPPRDRPPGRQVAALVALLLVFLGAGLFVGMRLQQRGDRRLPGAEGRGPDLALGPGGPGSAPDQAQTPGAAPAPPVEPIPKELSRMLGTPGGAGAVAAAGPGAGGASVGPARKAGPGYLDIYVEPWANVTLDGKALNQPTPLRGLSVRPGQHELILTNPVLKRSQRVQVRVVEGETRKVEIYLVNK